MDGGSNVNVAFQVKHCVIGLLQIHLLKKQVMFIIEFMTKLQITIFAFIFVSMFSAVYGCGCFPSGLIDRMQLTRVTMHVNYNHF